MIKDLSLYINRVRAAQYIEHDDSFSFRGINDDAWKLFYLERGALKVDLADNHQIVESGHMVFCGPREFYLVEAYEQPSDLLLLSFEGPELALCALRERVLPVTATMKKFLQNIQQQTKESVCRYPVCRRHNWRKDA